MIASRLRSERTSKDSWLKKPNFILKALAWKLLILPSRPALILCHVGLSMPSPTPKPEFRMRHHGKTVVQISSEVREDLEGAWWRTVLRTVMTSEGTWDPQYCHILVRSRSPETHRDTDSIMSQDSRGPYSIKISEPL